MNSQALKVLVPLDGSMTGESILPAILPLIRSYPVEATLLEVVSSAEEGEQARRYLAARQEAFRKEGLMSRFQVEWGQPADEILHLARTGTFDLVAMGTHGRTGLRRVLMGSVAEAVVRKSSVPVVLCRPDSRVGDWKRIVVALDGTPGAEEILEHALALANRFQSTLHLVRVGLPLVCSDGFRGRGYEFSKTDSLPYLQSIRERLASERVMTVAESRDGMAGSEIVALADELGAGLICMTTHGREEPLPGMGRSVAAEVIENAPCPVLILKMKETGVRCTVK